MNRESKSNWLERISFWFGMAVIFAFLLMFICCKTPSAIPHITQVQIDSVRTEQVKELRAEGWTSKQGREVICDKMVDDVEQKYEGWISPDSALRVKINVMRVMTKYHLLKCNNQDVSNGYDSVKVYDIDGRWPCNED